MNLFDFNKRFPDEESCANYLKLKREEEGIVCSKCEGTKHYWLESMKLWKCANCSTRMNLRAGTMMEKTKIPLKIWFEIIHLMTSIKKPFSALEMHRQVQTKFYEPVWFIMQKIRITMGKRDDRYQLQGEIEIDDAYFEVVDLEVETEKLKGGRGSQRQARVLVMAESVANPKQQNPHKKNRIMGFAKMIVMDDLKMPGVNYEVKKHISPTSIVISDSYSGYNQIKTLVKEHNPMVVPGKDAMIKLPWVHTVIANAKRTLLGVHHSIGKQFLQNYLNEFTYKLNRRTFESDLFDRLIVAGVHDTWY